MHLQTAIRPPTESPSPAAGLLSLPGLRRFAAHPSREFVPILVEDAALDALRVMPTATTDCDDNHRRQTAGRSGDLPQPDLARAFLPCKPPGTTPIGSSRFRITSELLVRPGNAQHLRRADINPHARRDLQHLTAVRWQ